jgi:hypothetical protein
MNTFKFRVQVAGGLLLIMLVGWPRFRPVSGVTVWASRGLAPQPGLMSTDARVQAAEDAETARRRRGFRPGSASQRDGSGTTDQQNNNDQRRFTDDEPTDLTSAGAKLNAIVGRARTLTNQPVPYGRMILRNTRTGLIEARTTADQEGRFSFLDVSQSGYVIELVGADGSVIASSELVNLNNGDLRQATVRVAANSTVRAIFGSYIVAPTVQEAVNRAVQSAAHDVSDQTYVASPAR